MYNKSLYHTRHVILTNNPKAKIIYRIHPHTGNIDEKNYEKGQNYDPRYNTGTIPGKPEFIGDHRDGAYWDDKQKSANWTIAYNSVLRNFMKSHNSDLSLDWYRLSIEAIEYYNMVKRKKDVRVNNNTLSTYTTSITNATTGTSIASRTSTDITNSVSTHPSHTTTRTTSTRATATTTVASIRNPVPDVADISTHIDSLHYCNEGVPRLSSVLLQLVIQYDLYKY